MSPMPPMFSALFFSIFHAFGGAALGRGLRTLRSDPQNAATLLLWGALMGLTPLLFDWFFLLRVGQWAYGVIGPGIFVMTALASAALWTGALEQLDGRAMAAAALGGSALVIGLAAAPLLVGAALAHGAAAGEIVFGAVWLLFFVGIGSGIAWTGLMALRHGRTFDQEARRRQRAGGAPRSGTRRKKPS
jgi:hypothetical protein